MFMLKNKAVSFYNFYPAANRGQWSQPEFNQNNYTL